MNDSASSTPAPLPPAFSQRREQAARQSISFLMQQGIENRNIISLAAGFVDEHTLPVSLVRQTIHSLLAEPDVGQQALQYGSTGGNVDLQHQLLAHLARLEHSDISSLGIRREQIVVTAGSQQLLNHVSEILLNPGDSKNL